jgi:4,5-dihydroxyphthalate decarboxylase
MNLELSVAIGDYDRTRALFDGRVGIDGVDPVFMLLSPEEMFFRAFRHADFDICELSLSSFVLRAARGSCREPSGTRRSWCVPIAESIGRRT